jgi:hypothetical protein
LRVAESPAVVAHVVDPVVAPQRAALSSFRPEIRI